MLFHAYQWSMMERLQHTQNIAVCTMNTGMHFVRELVWILVNACYSQTLLLLAPPCIYLHNTFGSILNDVQQKDVYTCGWARGCEK